MNAGEEYNKTSYVDLYPERENLHDQVQKHKELMQKSVEENAEKSIVLQPGFEKLEEVPVFQLKHKRRKEGLKERDKTKGFSWFNMPAPEMTDEKKNDLLVIQMRQALDPKQFYKRSAVKGNPKYFQVGTFVESPVEFYSSRIPKKQRKQTLVEELLADAEFRQYQKKKFSEIQRNQPAKFVKRKREKKLKPADFREGNAQKKAAKGKRNKSKKRVK
ncbi:deoxynucleotidyltransferase terminal-interacting protein 2 isoform X2 [Parasteatoda tepidariorum]|nr:deoxynucleotidyltransferase terminal-interacting protein 2 isoform X2 [Parasteatoda tepidariorum]